MEHIIQNWTLAPSGAGPLIVCPNGHRHYYLARDACVECLVAAPAHMRIAMDAIFRTEAAIYLKNMPE